VEKSKDDAEKNNNIKDRKKSNGISFALFYWFFSRFNFLARGVNIRTEIIFTSESKTWNSCNLKDG
jgi:hypothetical protein